MARMNDFINRLKEEALKNDEDVIYSQPIIDTRVIPPDEISIKKLDVQSIKVLPPKEEEKKGKPAFKIKPKIEKSIEPPPLEDIPIREDIIIDKKPVIESKPVIEPIVEPKTESTTVPKIEDRQKVESTEKSIEKIEYLFEHSETDISQKEIWIETYLKAQSSKKDNPIVRAVKRGNFAIRNGKVEILPDYDVYGKSSNDILKDKWL